MGEHLSDSEACDVCDAWEESVEAFDYTHSCSLQCKDKGNLVCLDATKFIYACKTSGLIHRCSEAQLCTYSVINEDGLYICLFSGRIMDTCMDYQAMYEEGVKIQVPELNKFVNLMSDDSVVNYELQMKDKKVKKPRQFVSYARFDEKTRRRLREKEMREKRHLCEAILETFLWKNNMRHEINEQERRLFMRKARKKCSKTLTSNKQLPNLVQLEAMYFDFTNNENFFKITPEDPAMREQIIESVNELWTAIEQTPYYKQNKSKIHYKNHVVGALKLLSQGYTSEKITVKKNAFVSEYMLTTKQITHFGYKFGLNEQGFITTSIRQIKNCFS
jgi:hypothetical protein